MSYILDALTKSQQKRNESAPPSLQTPRLMASSRKFTRSGHGVAMALAGVAVMLGVYLLLVEPGDPGASTPARDGADAASRSEGRDSTRSTDIDGARADSVAGGAPAVAPAGLDSPPGHGQDLGATAPRESGLVIDHSADSTPVVSAPEPASTTGTSVPAGKMPSAGAETRASTASTSVPVARADESAPVLGRAPPTLSPESQRLRSDLLALKRRLDEETRSSEAADLRRSEPASDPVSPRTTPGQATVVAAEPLEAPPLELFELPQPVQETALGLTINAHVYAEVPSERLVIINMRRYREGEQIREGPRIDAITNTGVTLSYRSERFHLDAR